jgi:hypothetical protein
LSIPPNGLRVARTEKSASNHKFDREKWETDIRLREREIAVKEREQDIKDREVQAKIDEQKRSRWTNPLVLAVLVAALAAAGNAGVALINGILQRSLEESRAASQNKLERNKAEDEQRIEEAKAEAARILEVIKTNDPDKAAVNLDFLLETGLIINKDRRANLAVYLKSRIPGQGPALPARESDFKRAFEIVGRSFSPMQFREYVSSLSFSSWKPEFIVLHHTGPPITLAQWHRVPGEQQIQQLANYWGEQLHWSGGPHLIIDDRVIWVVNPLTKPGIHAPSWNKISIGIEMVGDYDAESLQDDVRNNTLQALAILDTALGLKADTLRFHCEDPKTRQLTCPGANVVKEDFVRQLEVILSSFRK